MIRNTQIRNRAPLVAAVLLVCTAAAQQTPVIAAITNAASYNTGAVSPGTVVILWGENLGPAELEGARLNDEGLVDNALAGTRVLFNGIPAPLLYASATQVAAVTPYSLPPREVATVHAEYHGARSAPFFVSVVGADPGIFTMDASGRGGAVAWNDTGTLNGPGYATAAGAVVAFYITGAGQTDPAGVDGKPAAHSPGPVLTEPVRVTIGGAEAVVEYAGAAPGTIAGISQINARVPAEAVSGDQVFLSVKVGSAESQVGVTVAIAGTARSLPEPPAPLQASVQAPGRVQVAWTGSIPETVLRARLERSTSASDGFAAIAALPAAERSYIDTSVAPSATYYYRARFETAAGYTRYSPAAPVTTPAQPPAPNGFRATPVSHSRIDLEWSGAATADTIRIERKPPSGVWREIASLPGAARSYQDRHAGPATRYTYRVRSEAGGVFSAWSAESAASTPAFQATAGPPRIHPSEGRRLHWNGATWYPVGIYPALGTLTSDQTDYSNLYKNLLNRLAENNIDIMRAVFTMGQPYGDSMTVYQRTGPGLAADGRPKFDLTEFNQSYFDYWRAVAEYALARGIVLQICIVDLWHNRAEIVEDNGPLYVWGMKYDFYSGENNINGVSTGNHTEWMSETHPVFPYHQAMFRKLVDTVGDLPNIVWEIGNETGRTDWEIRMADIITAYEQSRGLPVRLVMPRDLPGHQLVPAQCVHDPAEVHRLLAADYGRNVPLINDNDCIYIGDAHDRRRRAWAVLTAGAHLDLFHAEIFDPAVLNSQDALDGMRYLGYLRTFLSELDVNLLGMRPSDDLVSNGWAYARPGQEYIIYLIAGGSTGVTGLPSAYTAVWFDPRNARTRPAGTGPTFIAPEAGDWVLYIRSQ